MKKKGFTLIEVIAVIGVLATILVIAIPKINDFILSRKKDTFASSAINIARQIEYNNLDFKTFSKITLKELDLDNISKNSYDLENSLAYMVDDDIYIDLVGKGQYEGLYVCNIGYDTKEVTVQDTPCSNEGTLVYIDFSVDLDGGTTSQNFSDRYVSGNYLILERPKKEGYTFKGWEVLEGDSTLSSNRLKFGTTASKIKAIWVQHPLLVVDLDGGESPQIFDERYVGGTMIDLIAPTKLKYVFAGWEITSGNSMISGNKLTIGTTDTRVVAKWVLNYSAITLNLDGGTTSQVLEDSYVEGSMVTLANPTKVGHTFTEWNIETGNSIIDNKNVLIVGSQDSTVKANYTPNTYQISYDLNGGSTGTSLPSSGVYGTTIEISSPTRVGYTFSGWIVSGAGSIVNGTSLTIGHENITLTAKWTVNTYQIKYELNGGTKGTNAPTSGTYGSTVTVSNPTRTGYTFNGWSVSGTGASLNGTSLTIGPSDVTLTAKWTINTYTISYSLSGGTVGSGSPTSGTYGSTVTLVDPTRTGYVFSGWSVTGTGAIISGKNLTIGSSDVTLTAKWTLKTVTVTFNKNDGTGSTATQTFTYSASGNKFGYNTDGSAKWGTSGQFGAWNRTGYTLLGWSESSSATTATYSVYSGVSDSWINSKYPSVTLYAVWRINTYTITYNLDGGTKGSSAPSSGTYGSTVTVSNPTKAGWIFTGWTVTGASMSGTKLTIGASNITLTANYKTQLNTYVEYLYSNAASTNSLQKDSSTDANIRYVGASPKNYVKFNGELWRIIGVFNETTSSGSKQKMVKLVRNASLINASWDSSSSSINSGHGIDEWSQADLKSMLNDYYYGSSTSCMICTGPNQSSCQVSCNSTVSKMSSTAKSMINNVVWHLGGIEYGGSDSSEVTSLREAYTLERSGRSTTPSCSSDECTSTDTVPRKSTWTGYIGLIYATDYGYASTDSDCSTDFTYNYSCGNNNWLDIDAHYWAITHRMSTYYKDAVWKPSKNVLNDDVASFAAGVRPSVYLKSNINIIKGTGTSGDPYIFQ